MLPSKFGPDRGMSLGLRTARIRLSALRIVREQPQLIAFVSTLLLLVIVLFVRLWPCSQTSSCAQCSCRSALASSNPDDLRLGDALPQLKLRDAAESLQLSMAQVVVGVMTARRFHSTRCRMQYETWLRRARRVIFFSDGPDMAAQLDAPVVAHQFDPSPTERVYSGGNWRALPIMHAIADAFFSEQSQQLLEARDEPLPLWAFMCDDDSFTFTSELLATLARLDANQPHYVGYAFIAAPHLEGIVPGVRQPLFANGGAGIAVSRAALRAVLPLLSRQV